MHTWPIIEIRRLLSRKAGSRFETLKDITELEGWFDEGQLERGQLLAWASEALGLPLMKVLPPPTEEALVVAKRLTYDHGVLPLYSERGTIWMAPLNPFDVAKADELRFVLSRPVRWVVADPLLIEEEMARVYEVAEVGMINWGLEEVEQSLLGESAKPPIIAWVDGLLEKAIKSQASDIHLESARGIFQIRLRTQGALHVLPTPSAKAAPYVLARLKHMAHVDVTQRRVPQDGRFAYTYEGRKIDFRLSTLPTHEGESLVLRVLDQTKERLSLTALGFDERILERLQVLLMRPYGLMLLTGPTGSGKTTTLYALLEALVAPERKIITVEDPIEYQLPGVTQIAVKNGIGLTFPRILRAALRHDPDMLMIGEVRDAETAAIAIQAALTGHRVFATLHCTDTVGAIPRLLELGIEPYLLAAALEAVIAQRLLLRLCPHCKEEQVDFLQLSENMCLHLENDALGLFYHAIGCDVCDYRGSLGRQAVVELLEISPMLREAISRGEPLQVLRPLALPFNDVGLKKSALSAVRHGDIGLSEFFKFFS